MSPSASLLPYCSVKKTPIHLQGASPCPSMKASHSPWCMHDRSGKWGRLSGFSRLENVSGKNWWRREAPGLSLFLSCRGMPTHLPASYAGCVFCLRFVLQGSNSRLWVMKAPGGPSGPPPQVSHPRGCATTPLPGPCTPGRCYHVTGIAMKPALLCRKGPVAVLPATAAACGAGAGRACCRPVCPLIPPGRFLYLGAGAIWQPAKARRRHHFPLLLDGSSAGPPGEAEVAAWHSWRRCRCYAGMGLLGHSTLHVRKSTNHLAPATSLSVYTCGWSLDPCTGAAALAPRMCAPPLPSTWCTASAPCGPGCGPPPSLVPFTGIQIEFADPPEPPAISAL